MEVLGGAQAMGRNTWALECGHISHDQYLYIQLHDFFVVFDNVGAPVNVHDDCSDAFGDALAVCPSEDALLN